MGELKQENLKPCPGCDDEEPLLVPGTKEVYCTECAVTAPNGNWNDRPAEDRKDEVLREAGKMLKVMLPCVVDGTGLVYQIKVINALIARITKEVGDE